MKICLISLRALPALSEEHKHERIGGAEVQCAQLAQSLVKLGHEVRLIVGDFGQPDEAVYSGVTTIKAKSTGLRFAEALAKADAEVYCYSCAGRLLGIVAAFCKFKGRRLVFRIAHDYDCDPRKVQIRRPWDRWLYHYGLKRVDAVLCQTASQQFALLLNHKVNASFLGMYVEQPTGPKVPKDIDVLWVANIKQIKRPDRLLDLAASMPGISFHMVGARMPAEGELYDQIEATARKLPNVVFHGNEPYRDIGTLFDRTRVFVNTSESEGFPNTFLQSWARSIPVVTMFDPDGVVKANRLGSACVDIDETREQIELMLAQCPLLASGIARFMAKRYSNARVTDTYLAAMHVTPREDWLDDAGACEGALRAAAAERKKEQA